MEVTSIGYECKAVKRVVRSSITRSSGHQVGYPRSGCRSSATLGVVVALEEEARAVARLMEARRRICKGPVTAIHGSIGGQPVTLLAWAGMGAAAATATECVLRSGVAAIAAVGFAGSLTSHLQPGDALAATWVMDAKGERWESDPELIEALGTWSLNRGSPNRIATRTSGLYYGQLLTSPQIVATATEKRRLGEETGALAVDIESGVVMRRAMEAGVPSIAFRVITDRVDEPLPLDFSLCCDSNGRLHRSRLVRMLARRPAAWVGMLRLARQSALAARTLTALLGWFVPRVAATPLAQSAGPMEAQVRLSAPEFETAASDGIAGRLHLLRHPLALGRAGCCRRRASDRRGSRPLRPAALTGRRACRAPARRGAS